jgi:hypothetical protein
MFPIADIDGRPVDRGGASPGKEVLAKVDGTPVDGGASESEVLDLRVFSIAEVEGGEASKGEVMGVRDPREEFADLDDVDLAGWV